MGRALAMLATLIGAAIVLACLAGGLWPRFAAQPVPQEWSGGALYLKSEVPAEQRCSVAVAGEPPRGVVVPGSPSQGLKLYGLRLDPGPDGRLALACPPDVTRTSGAVLRTYPLAENDPWAILSGIALLAGGSITTRLLRRRR